MVGQANVRGLSPSDGAATLLLSAVAILVGSGALIGALQNIQRAGDGEHSVVTGLAIMLMGALISGSLVWVVIS